MLASGKEALTAFGKAAGLGALTFGHDGICQVGIGENLIVEIEEDANDGTIRLNAPLRPVGDADFSVLATLLEANFNGDGTGLAALAINYASGDIVLCQAIEPKRHDAKSFVAEMDRFIRTAQFWLDRAAMLRPTLRDTADTPADVDSITLRL